MSENERRPSNANIITDKTFESAGYKIIQELGKSPRGTTYKGRRTVEQDIVAVKVFRNSACDRRFLDRLRIVSSGAAKCSGGGTIAAESRIIGVWNFAGESGVNIRWL